MKEVKINETDESKLKSKEIEKLFDEFENSKNKTDTGVEYWLARDLQKLLNYSAWREFNVLIDKSKVACKNAGIKVEDHFVVNHKMIEVGKGGEREIEDYVLDRYACYLISMNGSSSKEKISFAQTYFAIQTRKLEIIQERLKEQERLEAREKLKISETELSRIVYERGFKGNDFGIMRNKGDEALFGFSTKEMKRRLGVKENRPLADFADTVIIKAKDLAAAMTSYNTKEKDLYGLDPITEEHVDNNNSVRISLESRDIVPSKIAPKEDIKIVERRLKSDEKKNIKALAKNGIELENNQTNDIEVNISKDLWKYALYIMYNKRGGIVTTKELQSEIPTIIPVPREYTEISTTKGEPKLKQVIRNLKSNTKNKTSLVTQGYATLIKGGFQITPEGIEFVKNYFKQYL